MESKPYHRFAFILSVSFVIMYGVMFLNVDQASHVYLSLTRTYMTLLMVSPMAIVMIANMKMMYKDKKINAIIHATATAVFILCLILLRTQTPISDRQYIKAMIPHHSSAIMTSKHANLKDPEVKKLADQIILSQEREITLMKRLLEQSDE